MVTFRLNIFSEDTTLVVIFLIFKSYFLFCECYFLYKASYSCFKCHSIFIFEIINYLRDKRGSTFCIISEVCVCFSYVLVLVSLFHSDYSLLMSHDPLLSIHI